MLHFLLTGDARSKEGVLALARWVLDADDGNKTVFRWLSRAPTGVPTATRSPDYHGPGRGAAYSISTLLNAWRLTGASEYLKQAETFIRRCVHPDDDPAGLQLLDAENRWSYVVFLQTLGRYIEEKTLAGIADETVAYARSCLLTYARWMADHEYPYLERPQILEFPTETWAAQDLRKADVFTAAAGLTDVAADRERFRERAGFFRRAAVDWLCRFDTRTCTRPLVLLTTNGFGDAVPRLALPAVPRVDRSRFVPQKQVAFRRLRASAVLVVSVLILAVARWVLSAF
jgi:hypothetical protein